jgi:hypothetical protein
MVMWIGEQVMEQMMKERMREAEQHARAVRAFRDAGLPPQSARIRLGAALVRLGHRLMGEPLPAPLLRAQR